jgi:hypothetical protein
MAIRKKMSPGHPLSQPTGVVLRQGRIGLLTYGGRDRRQVDSARVGAEKDIILLRTNG